MHEAKAGAVVAGLALMIFIASGSSQKGLHAQREEMGDITIGFTLGDHNTSMFGDVEEVSMW